MGTEKNAKELFARYPDLGKLTLALLQHVVEPVLGKDAIKVIGDPYTNRQLYERLCNTLIDVEKRFIAELADTDIATGLLQLSLANVESIQNAFWEFVKNPANPDFPRALYKQLAQDYPRSTEAERYSVVDSYVKMLRAELIYIDSELRQKITAAALLDIQGGVESIDGTLKSIDEGVKTIADLLSMRNPPSAANQLNRSLVVSKSTRDNIQKVLVIFASSFEKDTSLANIVVSHLSGRYEIRKQDLLTRNGQDWAEKLNKEIELSDLIIPIISESVILNELLIFELDKAYRLLKETGKPMIVPVRYRYLDPYPYPLSEYISEIPCLVVHDLDTENLRSLTGEMDRVFAGQTYGEVLHEKTQQVNAILRPTPSINPFDFATIDNPKGTMSTESRFYIERPQDARMLRHVALKQTLINIKAPRQMGKSSMLVRGVERARQSGKRIVYLDFQQLDTEHLHDSRMFYITFCDWIAGNLDFELRAEAFWKSVGSNNIRCTRFISEVLNKLNQPLLLAIDEVDRLLASPFKSDFFGLLRSWHIDRQNEVMSLLSMMLVISTEPILLIDDIASPFNVGENLDLDDFVPDQVAELNMRHGYPFDDSQLAYLMTLVGGHPYLLRQAMYKVSTGELAADKFLTTAHLDDGPYSDHLLHHLFRLNRSSDLKHAMWQVIREHVSPSDEMTYRLKSAGLIREKGRSIIPRYGIYADYFSEHLKGA
jgi:hypothetical protein